MRKICKIVVMICLCIAMLSGIVVFAYYVASTNQEATGTITIGTENVIEVSSYNAFLEGGTDSEFNNSSEVSLASSRTILKLTSNITLAENVVLTKDIHIDLNGKTLDLNDHNLTLKHGYTGCFMLYGGTIERGSSGLGKIVLDLPNATLQTSSVTYLNNASAETEANTITVLSLDAKYTAYSALYMVGEGIASDLSNRPTFKTYDEVTALASMTTSLFVASKTCSYNSNTVESCSFIYQDIDLPKTYLSSDIEIVYTTSNATVITSYGKKAGTGNATITATVKKTGWSDVSVSFPVHVIDITKDTVKQSVGLALLKNYLADYYVSGNLIIKESEVHTGYYYHFKHAISLPEKALGGNIVYSYKTTNLSNGDNPNPLISKKEDSEAFIFEPGSLDYHLVITISGVSTSLNMYSTYVGLEENVAYQIANYLYGGTIVFDKASTGKSLTTLDAINAATSTDDLYDLKQYISSYSVTAISYALSGDVATHYEITSNELKLQSGASPEDKESSVDMTITIGGKDYVIHLYVEYLDSNGSTLASYITYYSIYNAKVDSELETSFEMPFCSNNIAPYTCYDIASYTTARDPSDEYTIVTASLGKPRNMKVELWYDGVSKLTFSYGASPTSFTNQLDAHLEANNLSLADLAAKTGANRAYYKFSMDAQNSIVENTKVVIIYNYKFDSSSDHWDRYDMNGTLTDNNTTYLTVLGGLFFNTTGKDATGVSRDYCVMDKNFFIWIYNKFKPNLTRYTDLNGSSEVDNRIIPMDWLGQAAIISTSDTSLSTVKNFNGIKYLRSVTKVDLHGVDLSTTAAAILTGISEMTSVEEINLSGCSLSDISYLSKLKEQGTLKILDISGNSIQYFNSITEITSLEKVYTYGNLTGNAYYGSEGICNFQAYADLMRNGCSVFNTVSNSVPVLYAESYSINDYRRLKEIAYQDMLKQGEDIETLYTKFTQLGTTITGVSGSDRPGSNPFGLQTAGTLSWGYQGDTNDGAKYILQKVVVGTTSVTGMYEYVNGAYATTSDTVAVANKTYYAKATNLNATYFYVTLTYTSGQILTVKFYVDRY